MSIKYCLPVIKNTKMEVLKALKIKGYDYYEIWVDYIKDLDEKFILGIAKNLQKKVIFVLRRRGLEKNRLDIKRRLQIIAVLLKLNVTIDLDFLTQHEELEFLKKSPTALKLILSFHHYKETPKLDYLQNLVNKMKRYDADIYKIATFCQEKEDALNLLKFLLSLKGQNIKFIVLGMGKDGLITRVFGALWGNEINFAPKKLKDKSAEGQLTKKGLELILEELR